MFLVILSEMWFAQGMKLQKAEFVDFARQPYEVAFQDMALIASILRRHRIREAAGVYKKRELQKQHAQQGQQLAALVSARSHAAAAAHNHAQAALSPPNLVRKLLFGLADDMLPEHLHESSANGSPTSPVPRAVTRQDSARKLQLLRAGSRRQIFASPVPS